MNKLTASEEVFSNGSALFDDSLGQRLCVLVPNSAKEFNETREKIKEARKILDEKCNLIDFVLKYHDKLKEIEINVSRVKCDIDYLEDDETNSDESNKSVSLAEYKNKMEILANYKLQFKSVIEEKEAVIENGFNKVSSNLEALNRKFNFESKQKLEKIFTEITIKITDLEVIFVYKYLTEKNSLNRC